MLLYARQRFVSRVIEFRHAATYGLCMPGLSERLQRHRHRRRMTQAAAAAELGVTQGTFGRWEKGTAIPGFDKVPAIAAFLEVTEDDAEMLIDSAMRVNSHIELRIDQIAADLDRLRNDSRQLADLREELAEVLDLLRSTTPVLVEKLAEIQESLAEDS